MSSDQVVADTTFSCRFPLFSRSKISLFLAKQVHYPMPFLIDHMVQLQRSFLASPGLNPVCPRLLFNGDLQTGHAIPGTVSQVTNTEGGSTLWICCLQILLIQYPGCCSFSQPQGHIAGPCSTSCPPRPPGPFQKSCFPVSQTSVCIAAFVYSIPDARFCICFC